MKRHRGNGEQGYQLVLSLSMPGHPMLVLLEAIGALPAKF